MRNIAPLVLLERSFVTLCFLVGQSAHASQRWLQIQSEHFELTGDVGSKQSLKLLRELEDADRELKAVSFPGATIEEPVRVFALRSDDEYALCNSRPSVAAFFFHSKTGGPTIVLGPDAIQRETMIHEYIHAVIHRVFVHLPMWMEEGLADFYSTIESRHGSVVVGRPPEDYLEFLNDYGVSYHLSTLLRLRRNDDAEACCSRSLGAVYAESWLLIHMLLSTPEYMSKFNDFVSQSDQEGQVQEELIFRLWGKSSASIENDLRSYLEGGRLATRSVPITCAMGGVSVHRSMVSIRTVRDPLDELLFSLGRPQR
jgi:hypothetical protein